MKITTYLRGIRSGLEFRTSRAKTRLGRGTALSAVLVAGATLLSPGWGVQRSLAGVGFPLSPTEDNTNSIAVFQLIVDPAFTFLFGPAPTFYYPGYSPGSAVLTSPTLYDFSQTTIGLSASHVRNVSSPAYFPVTVGTLMSPAMATVSSYNDFAFIPPGFANAPSGAPGTGVDEIVTEIESFALVCQNSGALQCTPDPRVPTVSNPLKMVYAGPDQITGLPLNRRSLGLVQQLTAGGPLASDFPAQSFFGIFVEVALPIVGGNNSTDFPPGGAILYNDANNPLIIVNSNITALPPTVVYIHGQTTAVPMRFKTSNPPYWAANDVIGYLTLAGHGVSMGGDKHDSNNCAQVTALLDQTLGPIGSSQPQMPVPWLRTNILFPTPGSGYNSVVNRPQGTAVLDDVATFTMGTLVVSVRDLSLGGLSSSILPPPAGGTATYTRTTSFTAYEWSENGGATWNTGFGSGTTRLKITNTNGGSNPTVYQTEMLQLDITGAGIMLRESPTLQSTGKHTIGPDPRGYRISSYVDVSFEASFDGVDWFPADRAIRMAVGAPPAAPGSIFISHTGTGVVLNWQNEFNLQFATSVQGPYQDVSSPDTGGPVTTGPYSPPMTSKEMYFRLRE